ncbi:putative receptor protein kinase [Hibiscus syriacus]|uniref:U-box domain-containing protein n=1 Tax=Hibiscus syriacus TaxID=106335 RepID=A0A6A3BRE6_HIBSY|nr:U-box domain-containing protein 21-like [Hibiscus syriacus]KAE8719213.1 putative receptor protein kinase [Hibiscus syriacus]
MMISSWRKRRAAKRAGKEQQRNENGEMELTIPRDFRCPISLDLMNDPVTLSSGITYDRESIEKWIEAGNFTCPLTNQVLRSLEPIPNHVIRRKIQDWCVENRSYGIERIPTPRVPISSVEVSRILSKIDFARNKLDTEGCRASVAKIKAFAKESERNKRCIATNGAGAALSEAFATFTAATSFPENATVLEEILSALITMSPLDGEAKGYLVSAPAIHSLIWFLSSGDLSRRRSAVLALKELVSSMEDQRKTLNILSDIEGAIEALFKLIKNPVCSTSTKASLTIIYHMITSSSTSQNQVNKLVNLGVVPLLLETLVDAERAMCEKALGVLDGIVDSEQCREMACNNALTIPVLVKKILRVSNSATEFSVSVLYKLCKDEQREDGGVIVEALQVGAFQKLLLLLQLGCVEKTKQRVSELLKMLNLHRNKVECVDPMDQFKDLKRPF